MRMAANDLRKTVSTTVIFWSLSRLRLKIHNYDGHHHAVVFVFCSSASNHTHILKKESGLPGKRKSPSRIISGAKLCGS